MLDPLIERSRPSYFGVLDPARGLAALAVVAFHVRFSDAIRESWPAVHSVSRYGFLGVHLFFIVSGYCLAAAAVRCLREKAGATEFLKRRLERIFLPFWCSVGFIVSLPWIKSAALFVFSGTWRFPNPLYLQMSWGDWFGIISLMQGFRFGSVPVHEKFELFNVVYWTLCMEVQFYLVVTLAVALKRWFYVVLILVSGLGVAALVAKECVRWELNTGLFLPYWPWFSLGLLLFELRTRDMTLGRIFGPRVAGFLGLICLMMIGVSVRTALIVGERPSPLWFGVLALCVLWLLISVEDLLARGPAELRAGIRELVRPVCWMGSISYSVYLVHFHIYQVVRFLLDSVGVGRPELVQLSMPVVVSVFCFPFFLLCERPFLQRRRAHRGAEGKSYV